MKKYLSSTLSTQVLSIKISTKVLLNSKRIRRKVTETQIFLIMSVLRSNEIHLRSKSHFQSKQELKFLNKGGFLPEIMCKNYLVLKTEFSKVLK